MGADPVVRVKSGKFRHQVNSDTHLQTVEIQMRRLLMSRLIRIFTVCLVILFCIPITELHRIFTVCLVIIPPQTLFVVGILFSRCPCVRASVNLSVTLCFLNILKGHCWIFIKPCKHVLICKTNTLNKKVRARGQFY